MGILGLTTFINNNPQITEGFSLHSTKVVIDGNSLYHFLYNKDKLDFLHGGDYDQYADKIREFFSLLQSCNIQPYVVFDGGNEPNDKKIKTVLSRIERRLQMAIQLTKQQHDYCRVMPIMSRDTFIAVLSEITIPFVVCDFEADKEIAKLANHLDSPVLSDDSDFYILPLTSGFIRLESLNLTVQEIRVGNDTLKHCLSARRYLVDRFVKIFPSLGKDVFPLLAALLGNDYVDKTVFKSFCFSIRSIGGETQFTDPTEGKKILKIILWLQSLKSYREGIEKIVSKSKDKDAVSLAIKITEEAFTLNATETEFSLSSYFMEKGSTVSNPIQGHYGSMIPTWYVSQHREGIIPPTCIDIITLHRKLLIPQVEDPKSSGSSYQCSESIRKYMYGVLLSEDIDDVQQNEGVASNRKCVVEEFDRNAHVIIVKPVYPLIRLAEYGKLPRLSEIPNLSTCEKENILRLVINMPSFSIDHMTKDLELVLGIVVFWIKEAKPQITIFHLQSVLVCLIMLKVKWVLSKHYAPGGEKNLIEIAVLGMDTKYREEVRFRLNSFNTGPKHNKRNPVECDLIHGFAQLQTCIMATMHFNYLLMCPFPSPCIPHIFSGTFLYSFCIALQNQRSPHVFIHELLSKDSILSRVYQCLYDAVIKGLSPGASKYFRKYIDHEENSKGKRSQRVRKGSQTPKHR